MNDDWSQALAATEVENQKPTNNQEDRRQQDQLLHAQRYQSLGQSACSIAHDFKSLLTGILGNACLAREIIPEDSRVHYSLMEIETLSFRAAELANQILEFSRNSKDDIPVSIPATLQDMEMLLNSAIDHRVGLSMLLSDPDVVFQGNLVQFRQVVLNLVTNAAEASVNCGHPVRIRCGIADLDLDAETQICCCERTVGRYCYFEVDDRGRGMDEETKRRVFEPYYTTKAKGTGLGMSTVYGIVKRHRGFLHLRSTQGSGTRCTVYLPVTPNDPCSCGRVFHIDSLQV